MSIVPLPVFEADADPHHRVVLTDDEVYARLQPPKTIVVQFGVMKLVGEFAYDGDARPGCGTKLVARTYRGTEMTQMLTTTCENAGCGKSISRKELLSYVANSGGRDFPFHAKGRILRVATVEDLNKQSALDSDRPNYVKTCRRLITELGVPMKLVEVEPILGGELLTFYYMSEERVDFRQLVKRLAAECRTRIEMRQVGARDEARLTADYERCGQYCCCKGFLKVLKPVSMKSAKVQKATLDPLKISGRCGRLMCCLRYEDQTYKDLKARLPRKTTRVGTVEGPGVVVDTKTLVQLVLVRLEHDQREIAVPVEELMDPETCPPPGSQPPASEADPLRGMPAETVREKTDRGDTPPERRKRRRRRRGRGRGGAEREAPAAREREGDGAAPPSEPRSQPKAQPPSKPEGDAPPTKRRRRRRRGGRRRGGGGEQGGGGGQSGGGGGGEG
jgi:cell fate regulator YaaT (PSP1 superfamily)